MDAVPPIPGLDPSVPGPSAFSLAHDLAFVGLVTRTYSERLGISLFPPALDLAAAAAWLYEEAPFCLLAHNVAADPRFIYANRTAQCCFEYDWEEMTSLPSRLSAAVSDRAERQTFIDTVAQTGFATGYHGLRTAKSGRSFWIENVTLWQLTDAAGMVCGQAAVYREWKDVEGGAVI